MQDSEYQNMYLNEKAHWWYVSQRELIEARVAEHAGKQATALMIFDAGCGTGGLAARLRRFGTVEGVDYSPRAIELCRQNGLDGMAQGDLNSLNLPPGRYDVVISSDVLYHAAIRDPADVINRMCSGLKPGGILILHVEAFEMLRSNHSEVVQSARRFRNSQIRAMVTPHMRIEKLTYRLCFLFPPVAAIRIAQRFRRRNRKDLRSDVSQTHRLLNQLLLTVVRMENRCLRWCNFPFGVSSYCVAARPD